jgi:hypothetical protein
MYRRRLRMSPGEESEQRMVKGLCRLPRVLQMSLANMGPRPSPIPLRSGGQPSSMQACGGDAVDGEGTSDSVGAERR